MNARPLIAVILLCFTLHPPVAAQVEYTRMRGDGRDIRLTTIADGIYQFTTLRDSYVRQLNSVAIVTDRDVLVFDTGTRPSSASAILARIRQLTPKPVRFVVNSHGHPDHWFGNGVYAAAFPDADIIATVETTAYLHRMAPVWGPRFTDQLEIRRKALAAESRSGKRPDGIAVTPAELRQDSLDLEDWASLTEETVANRRVFPTLVFADSLSLPDGGRDLHFLSVAGDADGTTVLWLPRERVLLTGDALSYPMPFVGPHPKAHIETLRRLASLDAAVIIPGHGPAFRDTVFLSLERRLLETIVAGVARERASGTTTLDAMQKRVTAADLRAAFTHGDADLEVRFPARVRDIVAAAFADTMPPPPPARPNR